MGILNPIVFGSGILMTEDVAYLESNGQALGCESAHVSDWVDHFEPSFTALSRAQDGAQFKQIGLSMDKYRT